MANKVISGPWKLFVATAGTSFTPGTFPETPDGYSDFAENLLDSAGIDFGIDVVTEEVDSLAQALPIEESVESFRITLSMQAINWNPDVLAYLLGRTKSTTVASRNASGYDKIRLDPATGPMAKHAFVAQSQNGTGGIGKAISIHLPHATVKVSGGTNLSARSARLPLMINSIYNSSANPELYQEA